MKVFWNHGRPSWLLLILISLLCYFLANFIFTSAGLLRLDLTQAQIHSISPGSKQKLESLQEQVTIRYYASKSDNTIPYQLREHGDQVEYFLDSLKRLSKGKVSVIRYDPKPGSDAEKSAKFDTITANFNRNQDRFYFGLSVSCLDRKVPIPFLHPDRKGMLEYDIMQAIHSVSNQSQKTIGIVGNLPVFGGKYSRDGTEGEFSAWFFVAELQKGYRVQKYSMDAQVLKQQPPDLLLWIHPVGADEAWERAVDQYLANGGKLIVMLDPYSAAMGMIDTEVSEQFKSSGLTSFLDAWGIGYSPAEVVADMIHRSEVDRGFGPEILHTAINIQQRYLHQEDPITSGVSRVALIHAGHFWPKRQSSIHLIPLVGSSEVVSTVQAERLVQMGREQSEALLREFASDGQRRAMVVKLLGELPVLFPETRKQSASDPETCQVVLFGDTDILFDPFVGERVQLSDSHSTVKPLNGNLALLSNTVDHLIGDASMATMRGKGSVRFPLSGLAEKRIEIEQQFRKPLMKIRSDIEQNEAELERIGEREDAKDMDLHLKHQEELKAALTRRQFLEQEMKRIERQVDLEMQKVKNMAQWQQCLLVPLGVFGLGMIVIYRRNYRARAL